MYKAYDSQVSAVFDFTPNERTKARSAFEEILAPKEESHALFLLHQWLLSRYQALNGSPVDSQTSAVFDFRPNERTDASSATEEHFIKKEDIQHV